MRVKQNLTNREYEEKYPWKDIEKLFMHGKMTKLGTMKFYTLKEVSEKFNVPYNYVRQRAAVYEWTKKQKYSRQLIEQRILELNAERIAKLADKLDNKTLDIATRAIETIRAYFIIQENTVKAAIYNKQKVELMSPATLEKIGKALMWFQRAGKTAIGEVMPPAERTNPFEAEFMNKEKDLTPDQKKEFVKLAIQFRKQSLEELKKDDNGNGNGNGKDS